MSEWSVQALNGIETVFRLFDFAGHVFDEVEKAGRGRNLDSFAFATTSTGERVGIPRWWIRWFEPKGEVFVGGNDKKVPSEIHEKTGANPTTRLGVVHVGFWHERSTDRAAPCLAPQILCGAGSISFAPWGKNGCRWCLADLGDQISRARLSWAEAPKKGEVGHVILGADFEWLEPVPLHALTTGEEVQSHAVLLADHIAKQVAT